MYGGIIGRTAISVNHTPTPWSLDASGARQRCRIAANHWVASGSCDRGISELSFEAIFINHETELTFTAPST